MTYCNLLPAQREYINIPHKHSLDVALYQGGYGSGKTFCGSLLGILLALKYAGIKGLVGAQTFPLVRDTTLVTYQEHLDNMGLIPNYHYKYNVAKGELVFFNGSIILFRHLEEPNKLKSLNLGFVEIEEMSEVPESTFKMLLSRLRQKNHWGDDFQYRLFGHTNPEMSKGYIYKYFVEQKHDNYRFIQAPTTQNIYLPKHYVEELKNAYDEEYFRINVLGEFGDYTSGLVVKNFTSENINPKITYLKDYPIYITWDFNVDPMSCIIAHKTDDKVFFIDEIILENSTTQNTIDEFIRRYGNHEGDIIVTGDASGDNRSTQSELSNYMIIKNALKRHFKNQNIKFCLRPYNPPIKNRISAFNAMVCNHEKKRKLLVHPRCEKLLYNIHNLKYKVGTSIVDVPSYAQIRNENNLKFLEHPFDAASYLIEYFFPIKIEKVKAGA